MREVRDITGTEVSYPLIYDQYSSLFQDYLSSKVPHEPLKILNDEEKVIEASSNTKVELVGNILKNILRSIGFRSFHIDKGIEERLMEHDSGLFTTGFVKALKETYNVFSEIGYSYVLDVYPYTMPDMGEYIVFEFRVRCSDYRKLQELWNRILSIFYRNMVDIDKIHISVRSEG
ncbi:MAG: hypothetical protein J7K23_02020 [Thermoproteales archaeon]|nr:hypothetical protein [Thermoproteales archaeon]